MSHKLIAFDDLGKLEPMNIAQTIRMTLVIGGYSVRAAALENVLNKGVITGRRWRVSLCRLTGVDALVETGLGRLVIQEGSAYDNVVWSAQETAIV